MTKEKALKKIWELAIECVKDGEVNQSILRQIDNIAYDYDIFVSECDDGIAIEDDIVYFNH